MVASERGFLMLPCVDIHFPVTSASIKPQKDAELLQLVNTLLYTR